MLPSSNLLHVLHHLRSSTAFPNLLSLGRLLPQRLLDLSHILISVRYRGPDILLTQKLQLRLSFSSPPIDHDALPIFDVFFAKHVHGLQNCTFYQHHSIAQFVATAKQDRGGNTPCPGITFAFSSILGRSGAARTLKLISYSACPVILCGGLGR